jgi:DNA-binding MarR family transcriptional regulator
MGLRAAYLTVHRRADAHFARQGATADQFVLLALLAHRDGITQQELVRRASSDPNTVRAMLVLLEGRGLVARKRHPTDGRARCITLTAKGRRVHEKLFAGDQPFRDRFMALFRPDEAEAMVEYLGRISSAMTEGRLVARSRSRVRGFEPSAESPELTAHRRRRGPCPQRS